MHFPETASISIWKSKLNKERRVNMKVIREAKTDKIKYDKEVKKINAACDHIKCKLCPPMKD